MWNHFAINTPLTMNGKAWFLLTYPVDFIYLDSETAYLDSETAYKDIEKFMKIQEQGITILTEVGCRKKQEWASNHEQGLQS